VKKIPNLASFAKERLYFRKTRNEPDTPMRTVSSAAELCVPAEQASEIHLILADSLDTLERDELTSEQRAQVRQVVIADAYELAASILPPDIALAMQVETKHKEKDVLPPETPAYRDIYLLAHAYDKTRDQHIREVLEYILDTIPPTFSEQFASAYAQAIAAQAPIIPTYNAVVSAYYSGLDLPKTASEVNVAIAMEQATPKDPSFRNTEWEEYLQRVEH
jgi:hypothetical protein